MNTSHIEVTPEGKATSYVGPDATMLFANRVLVSALRMYARSKMLLTRGATPSMLLARASAITGKKYKRGQYVQAADDVQVWCDTMLAALPIIKSE